MFEKVMTMVLQFFQNKNNSQPPSGSDISQVKIATPEAKKGNQSIP
jgi:hypothetical protein